MTAPENGQFSVLPLSWGSPTGSADGLLFAHTRPLARRCCFWQGLYVFWDGLNLLLEYVLSHLHPQQGPQMLLATRGVMQLLFSCCRLQRHTLALGNWERTFLDAFQEQFGLSSSQAALTQLW